MLSPTYLLQWCRLSLQPSQGELVVLEEVLRLLVYLFVVIIDPLLLALCQELDVNQVPAVRRHGHMLEAEKRAFAKLERRLHLLDECDVLDADAEVSILVVARLNRRDIARCHVDVGVVLSRADANGSFVHVQVGAYTVACPVAVVQSLSLRLG